MSATDRDVELQLERLLANEKFVSSPRKAKLLKYLVEKSLAGEENSLKGYAIGVDVFDRAEDFDPQTDSIVRVEVGRLRRLLELYYLTNGSNDPIRIEIPKGGNAPAFSQTTKTSNLQPNEAAPAVEYLSADAAVVLPNRFAQRWKTGLISISLGFLLLFLGFFFVSQNNARASFRQATIMPTGPSVAIEPFEVLTYAKASGDMAVRSALVGTGLHFELIDKISRFKDLLVIEIGPEDPKLSAQEHDGAPVQYLLSGKIKLSETRIVITSILHRRSNGAVVWSQTYDEALLNTDTLLDIQASIASDVAASLGQPHGAVFTNLAAERTRIGDMNLDHYLCLMDYYGFFKNSAAEQFSRVKTCLMQATSKAPNFSSAWAALSWMYDYEQHAINTTLDPQETRAKVLATAQKAVSTDPENAMAYQYLAIAKFNVGDDEGFRDAARIALQLNPNDAEVLADVGSHLIQLDNSKQGKLMVEKAIRLNPGHPPWYHGSIAMYHYTHKETDRALHHARQNIRRPSLGAYILLTASLVQNNEIVEAKKTYRQLLAARPVFAAEYQRILRDWRLPEGMREMLLQDLQIAGLKAIKNG